MWNIALNTFRELIRNKLFSLIGVFGATFIILSFLLETLSLGEVKRMIFDFGMSFIEITGVFVVLFIGGQMIYREIEGRTIYLMLSKPISRGSILLGKFFGFAMALAIILGLLSTLLSILLVMKDAQLDIIYFLAILGIYIKFLSLLAIILFFSTFVSPMVAMFVTGGIYFIGHGVSEILAFAARKWMTELLYLGKWLALLFPNYSILNLKNIVDTDAPILLSNWLTGYGLQVLYIVVILYLGTLIFSRKSFDNA